MLELLSEINFLLIPLRVLRSTRKLEIVLLSSVGHVVSGVREGSFKELENLAICINMIERSGFEPLRCVLKQDTLLS